MASNPLAGRMAWCGDSGGYINTVINLPASMNGQTIKLRFVMGTDEALARPGAHVDVLTITNASCPVIWQKILLVSSSLRSVCLSLE